jgi:hypothetical protein
MSEKTQTITGGLGLNENFFKEAEGIVKENLEKYDTISEALAATASEVRDGELGEVDIKITAYEKKLVLAGFVMGCVRASSEAQHKLEMLETLGEIKSMVVGKIGGKTIGKLPKEIIEAMRKDPDLPKELRDILGEIEEGDDE